MCCGVISVRGLVRFQRGIAAVSYSISCACTLVNRSAQKQSRNFDAWIRWRAGSVPRSGHVQRRNARNVAVLLRRAHCS